MESINNDGLLLDNHILDVLQASFCLPKQWWPTTSSECPTLQDFFSSCLSFGNTTIFVLQWYAFFFLVQFVQGNLSHIYARWFSGFSMQSYFPYCQVSFHPISLHAEIWYLGTCLMFRFSHSLYDSFYWIVICRGSQQIYCSVVCGQCAFQGLLGCRAISPIGRYLFIPIFVMKKFLSLRYGYLSASLVSGLTDFSK
jgi:hypothetical protein